jgi:two-component system, NarL family, nitrate/nitrite response regulator NarL
LLREGIASVLQSTPYRVMAGVAQPEELGDIHYPNERPVLAIVGIEGGNLSLEEAGRSIQQLRSLIPNGKIVLVVEASEPIDLHSILALAPDGCILNPRSRQILVKALELTFMDQQIFVLAQSMPTKIKENNNIHTQEHSGNSLSCDSHRVIDAKTVRLSQRERQVLICLAQGKSNKVISRLCGIAEATVKAHLKAILRKTNAHNRTQAAIWAIQHGFQAHALTDEGNLAVDPTAQAAE